ncbi:hypothetical protein Vafri_11167, partial [Volvox africanus]
KGAVRDRQTTAAATTPMHTPRAPVRGTDSVADRSGPTSLTGRPGCQLAATATADITAAATAGSATANASGAATYTAAAESVVITDKQIRDELITMFFAGTDSSALILTLTAHHLAHQPEAQKAARAEVKRGSGVEVALANNGLARGEGQPPGAGRRKM